MVAVHHAMPFDHSYETETCLLVLRGSGKGSIDEIIDSARRILRDPHLLSARGVMIVASETEHDPTPEEGEMIAVLRRSLKSRYGGPVAFVTTVAGRVTTAHLVSLMASDGGADTRAFMSEEAARAWLLGIEPERSGLRRP